MHVHGYEYVSLGLKPQLQVLQPVSGYRMDVEVDGRGLS